MGKNIVVKICKYCGIETTMSGICNGFNCEYAGEKVETVDRKSYDPLAYGKEFKTCPRCHQELPALDNYFHRGGTGSFDYCHECQADYSKEYCRLGRDISKGK